ncbi:MAG: zinc-dependent alcohol dehydrogenase family protein [Granulosicoccus sp.]|nr:zinc-dependent alcohol dehydrogenase family protein [Granulosicoccus sp.]
MKAIVYNSLGSLGLSDLEMPALASGMVRVKTAACGLCHTDIDVLHGRYGNSSFPVVPGHEYSGIVEEVGEAVTSVSAGDRVVVDPNISCGHCRACRRGLRNLCETLQAYGVTTNGGFAEHSVVSEANIVPIGDMPFNLAALAEPLGCVLNGIGEIETKGAANAVVVGAGPIGLLMALALKDAGIPDVSVVDIDEGRLDFVRTLGLNAILSAPDTLASMERSVDVVVDATGVPAVVEGLFNLVANGGNVLFFGVCPPDSRISISPFDIFRRQIRVAGAHSLNHNIPEALAVLRRSGEAMSKIISHELPLSDIASYLDGPHGGGSMKVQYKAF